MIRVIITLEYLYIFWSAVSFVLTCLLVFCSAVSIAKLGYLYFSAVSLAVVDYLYFVSLIITTHIHFPFTENNK